MRKDCRSYVAYRAGEPCRICGNAVQVEEMAGRKLYWCPVCQLNRLIQPPLRAI